MEEATDDLEKSLLNKLINKKSLYYDNHSTLSHELFINPIHKAIYIYLDKEYQDGNNFDIIKAGNSISHIKNIDYIIGDIMAMDTYFMSIQNIVGELTHNNKRTKMYAACENFLQTVRKDTSEKPVDNLVKSVNSLEVVTSSEIVEMQEHISNAVKEIEISCSTKGITGITTGFKNIDEFTGGWKKQDLIIVGGASSMGKTSLALAFASNSAVAGVPTAIFSYEMSTNQMVKRLISSDTEIGNKSLMEGEITPVEWNQIHKSMGRLEKLPLYIDDCNKTDLRYLLNRIRQYVITKNVKLVMVDYLQLVSNSMRGRSREQEVSIIARSLKNIAKELDITIMALSQLSRGVEKRQGCRPTLGDLRESGEIEQAADVVTLVYRPEYYGFEEDEKGQSVAGIAEIIFAKGRNIGVGSRFLNFVDYLTKFKEIEQNF